MEKRNNPYMLKTFCGCCKIETAVLALTILHLVFGPVPLFVLLVKRALTVKIYFRYIIHLILSLITLFGLLTVRLIWHRLEFVVMFNLIDNFSFVSHLEKSLSDYTICNSTNCCSCCINYCNYIQHSTYYISFTDYDVCLIRLYVIKCFNYWLQIVLFFFLLNIVLQFYICWIYISLIYEYKNRADYRKDYQIISVWDK